MKLLVVESPGKIKKLKSILNDGWNVVASCGHIRDLPNENYGIEPPDFVPNYEVTKSDVVKKLKEFCNEADEVYLASDPDREGEAIAWHLKETLNLKSYKRVTYTAITKADVESGIASPREIDMNLVHAQEARRSIDRLVGYKVSFPLSQALGINGLSAGRVQSPAVEIVVDREKEIQAFKSVTHYGVDLIFDGWKASWLPHEGWLDKSEQYFLDKNKAEIVSKATPISISAFTEKETKSSPPAPFITSTLQQAASNALKFKPKYTMELAQKLYEAGHITYMRTDSPNLSETAVKEIRDFLQSVELPLSDEIRTWKSKAGAQEAHEAIRPTHIENSEVDMDGDQSADAQKLYKMIRDRTLACQCADAMYSVRIVRLSGGTTEGKDAIFEGRGKTLIFEGWKAIIAKDDAEEAKDNDKNEESNPIPELSQGESLIPVKSEVITKKTKPRPRFTQATLIKELEKSGIGRPATYAQILDNIMVKEYLSEEKSYLIPTDLGFKLVAVLRLDFTFMDLSYTKKMENSLDDVANGKCAYAECVNSVYGVLMEELRKFKVHNLAVCPVCGESDEFMHFVNTEKGYNFWACKACNNTFADSDGKPGKIRKKPESTEFKCEKCGSLLNHIKGSNDKGEYDFFACSSKECGAKYKNVDGKPSFGEKSQGKKTMFKCPECGKVLIERPTKNGGKWYGCSGFPECKAKFWEKDGKPDFGKKNKKS